jgi:hypothetical protein
MKKSQLILLPVFMLSIILLMSFTLDNTNTNFASNPGDKFKIPDDINQIFENSCFGCHNVEAQSDKAKKKLLIDQLSELSTSKLIGKLDAIAEAVKENEMPPEKFLAKYPDNKLTEEESARLQEWANATVDELMK